MSWKAAVLSVIPNQLIPAPFREGATYSRHDFRADLIAGVTVAVIQIPQSMALALIAGLPAIFGLYASLVGCIASLWGSSRQLSTGPMAIVSFLTFTSLAPFAESRSSEYIALAGALAVFVGLIYLLLGFFRFGFILQLVPHSVVTGFSSAAAIIIVVTQLPNLFGLPSAQHSLAIQNILDFFVQFPNFSLITVTIGATAVLLLIFFRRFPATFPSALVILLLGISAGYIFSLLDWSLITVGIVPAGAPSVDVPPLSIATLFLLFPKAVIIALVGFVGAHATAKNAASKTRERLDTDQELVGQGLANVAAGFFSGFPISGSFTRTAINVEAGARTAISAVVGAVITLLVLFFFTPLFEFLPRSILAAIVIVSAIPLINLARLRAIKEVSYADGLIAYLTFGLALVFAPDDAIFIGVVAALMVFIWQTTSGARVSEMGVNKEWNVLRGVNIDDTVETFPGTVIAHIGMSMYYANTEHLLAQTERLIADRNASGDSVRNIVLDISGVHFIDISGLEMLSEFVDRMKEKHVRVGVIYIRHSVRIRLEKMRRSMRVTIFHNITEFKNECAPPSMHTLSLGGSKPEHLEASE